MIFHQVTTFSFLAKWVILHSFLSFADYFQNIFFNILSGIPSVSYSLDPDQVHYFAWPDLGPNCLQMLSSDDTSRQRVNSNEILIPVWYIKI